MHWHGNQLLVMPYFFELQKCLSVFPANIFDDDGIESNIMNGYICFDLAAICERYDIDAKEIFPENEN